VLLKTASFLDAFPHFLLHHYIPGLTMPCMQRNCGASDALRTRSFAVGVHSRLQDQLSISLFPAVIFSKQRLSSFSQTNI